MIDIRVSQPADWRALGVRWRGLEEPFGASFFQSWTWLGCMVERRFPDPVLIEAFSRGSPVGIALFNRRSGRLHLSETGEPELDRLTVEHNGVLADPAHGSQVRAACLQVARRICGTVALSGVGDADAEAAQATGPARLLRSSLAPHVDLEALRRSQSSLLGSLSANTRYQVSRSDRRYRQDGPLCAEPARDVATALAFFEAMVKLHGARWAGKGLPGAFSSPLICQFHRRLIADGWGLGHVELWKVAAGHTVVGYLYNFRYRDAVCAYQSGFADEQDGHRKPGLTSHARVIEACRNEGVRLYDFLAGADRYKTSFANGRSTMRWMLLMRTGSPDWQMWQVKRAARRLRDVFRRA